MTRLTQLCTTTILTTVLAGSASLADVTALQVWDGWQAAIDRTDTTASFDQSISNGILTINNLTLVAKDPDGAEVQFRLGSLVLQDQGDGTVAVILPNDAPIVVTMPDGQITLNQSHKDLSFVASGSDSDVTYTYSAADITLKLVELIVEGEKISKASGDVTLTALAGVAYKRGMALLELGQTISIGSVSYALDITPEDEAARIISDGALKGIAGTSSAAIPENLGTATILESFDAGLRADLNLEYRTFNSSFSLQGKGKGVKGTAISNAGKISMTIGNGLENMVDIAQNISFGSAKLHIETDKTGSDAGLLLDLALDQIGGGFNAQIPDVFENDKSVPVSAPEALDAGFSMAANFGTRGIDASFNFTEDQKSASGSLALASAGMEFSLDRNGAHYGAGSLGLLLSGTTSELPIGPVEVSATELNTELRLPLATSDHPTPFSYEDRYIDLTISDNLWAMFDPAKLLPRGPATYILDISGMANWLVDPFDKSLQNHTYEGKIGELHSLNLNKLQLTVAGVDLTGDGRFTFNNDDLETFDGIPAPIGTLDLKLIGFQHMVDALIKLGALPEDQAFLTRMGIGMFTVAGDGKDTLISHIEATEDGHILANGKRLK